MVYIKCEQGAIFNSGQLAINEEDKHVSKFFYVQRMHKKRKKTFKKSWNQNSALRCLLVSFYKNANV